MFEVTNVTAEADLLEPMGSKPKFWFEHPDWGHCLFKAARPGSGEDWSEKLAAEFAAALDVPHAQYHLASWKGEHGIVTRRLTTDGERLVHGNELLIELDPGYDAKSKHYRTPLHTVRAVLDALRTREVGIPRDWTPPDGVETSGDVFTGYLLLDALIGNTDRHHENWAAIEVEGQEPSPSRSLSPTFDHASSMGRNEPIERMQARLTTRDEGYNIEAYASRTRSALYSRSEDPRPLSPLDAFTEAASLAPGAAAAWCNHLTRLTDDGVEATVNLVPDARMSPVTKSFVTRMICFNRRRLEDRCGGL